MLLQPQTPCSHKLTLLELKPRPRHLHLNRAPSVPHNLQPLTDFKSSTL